MKKLKLSRKVSARIPSEIPLEIPRGPSSDPGVIRGQSLRESAGNRVTIPCEDPYTILVQITVRVTILFDDEN